MSKKAISLSEWKRLEEGAKKTSAKFGVEKSDYGSGYLNLTQTEYEDGGRFIFPEFFPSSAKTYICDGETKQFSETISAPKGGYKNGRHAIRLMRERFNMTFKTLNLNNVHEDDT